MSGVSLTGCRGTLKMPRPSTEGHFSEWEEVVVSIWKHVKKPAVFAAMALAGTALASQAPQAQEFKFTYAGYPSPKISSGKAVNFFAAEVEKRTNGRVKFKIHHSGSLYQEEKALEALLAGSIDFAAAGTSTVGVFTRHYDWVNLPFIVSGDLKTGPRQLLQMINSDVGKEIQARVEKETGLKLVYIMPSNGGARAIATRKVRLVVPADIRNTKQRVSLAPLDIVINKAWGANPVPVPWADTFTGFSQGVFEGVQIPIPHIHNVGFDEIAKHITMVNFQYLPQVMWVRVDFWNKLPADIRKVMTEVGEEAALYEMKVDQEAHQAFRDAITKRGAEIIDLTPEQMAMWQKESESVYKSKDVAKYTPPALLARLRKAGMLK